MSDANSFDLGTVIDDAKAVVTNPVGFYREMPTEGGLANPIIFVLVMSAATAVLSVVLSMIGLLGHTPGFGGAAAGGMMIAAIIMMPIMMLIGSFIGAAILFVIWKLMGSENNYEVAYRCMAYSTAIMPVVVLISIIPYIGGLVQKAWMAFLMIVASTEVHKIKKQTAMIVFGVLAVLFAYTGVKGEYYARNPGKLVDKWSSYAEKVIEENSGKELPKGSIGELVKGFENAEEMTPEEAGQQVGEFLKNLEQFSKGLEESVTEGAEENNGGSN